MNAGVDHPMLIFLFALANLTSGIGFLFVAGGIMVRARIESRYTKAAGIGMMLASACAHFGLAFLVLFRSTMTASEAAAMWPVLTIHIIVALCVWTFLVGIYLQVGRWADMPTGTDYDERGAPLLATGFDVGLGANTSDPAGTAPSPPPDTQPGTPPPTG